jgi:hypothetical protein
VIDEVRKLLDDYAKWLREKTTLRQIDGKWVEITTPHLDRHNDYLQIYCRLEPNGSVLLSDDGYVIDDLKTSGCDLDTPKRHELLMLTLAGFGVRRERDALQVISSRDNFPMQKHNLIQAMLAVNDLFYLSKPAVASFFLEDVIRWLEIHQVRYTPRVKFTGRTGYDHLFDFVIPKSRRQPERILKAINHPSKDTAMSLVFAWLDTKEVRPPDSRAYAVLNDTERVLGGDVIEALNRYEIIPVPWSKREESREELAA